MVHLAECLNRTFMELKPDKANTAADKATGLNRTFMELKLATGKLSFEDICVLIVPLWN